MIISHLPCAQHVTGGLKLAVILQLQRQPQGEPRVRPRVLLCAFAVALLAFLALPSMAQEARPIVRIGVLTDMSGSSSSAAGQGSVVAARLAAQDHGGMALGAPIEIVAADHQNKPDVGSELARRWLDQDGVSVLVDLAYTQIAFAAVDVAKQRDRAALITSAVSSDLTGRACSLISTHWTDDTYALAVGTARALTRTGLRSWFFITADYAFGHALQRDATAIIEAEGGTVLGSVRHPLGSPDMAPYVVRAGNSGAQVIGLANVSSDLVAAIKQADEFGIDRQKQRLAGFLVFINDVQALGLATAQGLVVTTGFYWDQNDASRAFAQRFLALVGRMPSKAQAAAYASVRHWLKAVAATGGISGEATTRAMRELPVDYFGRTASIRTDGRVLYDLGLYEVKSPAESRGDWDYYRPVMQLSSGEAFRPLSEGSCPSAR